MVPIKAAVCLATLVAVALASPQSPRQAPSVATEAAVAPECVPLCEDRYRVDRASNAEHPCFKGCNFSVLRKSSQPALEDTLSGCYQDCQEAYKDDHERAQCNTGCSMGSSSKLDEDNVQGRSFSFRIPLFNSISSRFGSLDDGFVSFPGFNIFGGSNSYENKMDEVEDGFKQLFDSVKKGVDQRLEEVVPPIKSAFSDMKNAMEDMSTDIKLPAIPSVSADRADVNNSAQQTSIGQLVASQVNEMMRKTKSIFGSDPFSSMFGNLFDFNSLPHEGNGKLVVIKSGPGYHEEKTYNINADTDISQILKDDMMNEPNPLDDLADDNKDVEVFTPKTSDTDSDENDGDDDDDEEDGHMDIEVFGPLTLPFDPSIKSDNDIDDSIFEMFGPIRKNLEGDRQPFSRNNIVLVDLCAQDRSQMTWSQWFACLHARVGVPRWLMAATICSGIILSIWLCLVIPKNISKKGNKSRKSIGVKELEASSNPHSAVVVLDSNYPLDLPPSYDDVACTKVKPQPDVEKQDPAITDPLPPKNVAIPPPGQV